MSQKIPIQTTPVINKRRSTEIDWELTEEESNFNKLKSPRVNSDKHNLTGLEEFLLDVNNSMVSCESEASTSSITEHKPQASTSSLNKHLSGNSSSITQTNKLGVCLTEEFTVFKWNINGTNITNIEPRFRFALQIIKR